MLNSGIGQFKNLQFKSAAPYDKNAGEVENYLHYHEWQRNLDGAISSITVEQYEEFRDVYTPKGSDQLGNPQDKPPLRTITPLRRSFCTIPRVS